MSSLPSHPSGPPLEARPGDQKVQLFRFRARTAAEALEEIRTKLGPEAVVVHVNQAARSGLSRLWHRPSLEVLACLPAPEPPPASIPTPPPSLLDTFDSPPVHHYSEHHRCAQILEKMGLSPLHVERVLEQTQAPGSQTNPTLGEELQQVRQVLLNSWRPCPKPPGPTRHVFVGPPGSGKTTVLCKWLTQAVLMEGQPARVWRLDGTQANLAEALSVHGEILGIPVHRGWKPQPKGLESQWIDLPGISHQNGAALDQLLQDLAGFQPDAIHLVLNAAYTLPLLTAQIKAFARLPITDLIFTHVDEERNLGKLWNFVLGTNLPISHLAGGQNIPGEFNLATAERLFPAFA